MVNEIWMPGLNPVMFYEENPVILDKYQTKHYGMFPFSKRLLPWQPQDETYVQIWQTTEVIRLQFESTFDTISVQLLDEDDNAIITLLAVLGLPHADIPYLFSYEVAMSLAGIDQTGCYRLRMTAGSGAGRRYFRSGCQYISIDPIPNSVCLEYWHSHFHKDVIFETGIKFQLRVPGHFKFLDKIRNDEKYRDEKFNPALLSSKSARQWPFYFGDEFGLPDEMIDLIDEAWGCDHVMIDNTFFTRTDEKNEYIEIEDYPKRGLKIIVEEGINRSSRIFSIDIDPTKKIISTIMVEAVVFGDTSNQGSTNTVPVFNIQNIE
ncbi:MAG: hypothetical protein ABIN94_21600 [Ferruginibacter sp.]